MDGAPESGGALLRCMCKRMQNDSVMAVCALFCLCVYNESSVIGQVDVVSDEGNALQ